MIGRHRGSIFGLGDRNGASFPEDLAEQACLPRVEVLHQDESHAGRRRQLGQQFRHRLEPPGRSTDADYRKSEIADEATGSVMASLSDLYEFVRNRTSTIVLFVRDGSSASTICGLQPAPLDRAA